MSWVKEWAGVLALILVAAYIAFGHQHSSTPTFKDAKGYYCNQKQTDWIGLCPDDPFRVKKP